MILYQLIYIPYPNGLDGAELRLGEELTVEAWELPNGFDGADWKGFEFDEAAGEFWVVVKFVTEEPNGFDAEDAIDGFQMVERELNWLFKEVVVILNFSNKSRSDATN